MSDAANSPYTIPTGPGYVGIYNVSEYTAYISITTTPVDWSPDTDVVAADHSDEPGIQLVESPAEDTIDDCRILDKGYGTIVHLRPDVLRELPGFEKDADVRIYERDPEGLTLVAASDDPFVDGGEA